MEKQVKLFLDFVLIEFSLLRIILNIKTTVSVFGKSEARPYAARPRWG